MCIAHGLRAEGSGICVAVALRSGRCQQDVKGEGNRAGSQDVRVLELMAGGALLFPAGVKGLRRPGMLGLCWV